MRFDHRNPTHILAALLLVNVIVHAPMLWQCPRADHLLFLGAVAGKSWLEVLRIALTFGGSDGLLFRPLTRLTEGLEFLAFGNRALGWQLVTFWLHLGIVAALYKLLYAIRPMPLAAGLVTLWWSLLPAQTEEFYWGYETGYMICMLLVVVGLRYIESAPARAAFCLGLACFFHEGGVVAAVVTTLVYWKQNARILATGPGLYFATIAARFVLFRPHGDPLPSIGAVAAALPHVVAEWFLMGAVPCRYNLIPADRMSISALHHWSWMIYFVVGLTALVASSIALRFTRRTFALIPLAVAAAYPVMFTVVNLSRGFTIDFAIRTGLYYLYPVWLMLAIGLWTIYQPRAASRFVTAGLLFLTCYNGYRCTSIGFDYIEWSAPRNAYFDNGGTIDTALAETMLGLRKKQFGKD